MSDRLTGTKVFFFVFFSWIQQQLYALNQNGIVSLMVAAAFAILALTAVKIP